MSIEISFYIFLITNNLITSKKRIVGGKEIEHGDSKWRLSIENRTVYSNGNPAIFCSNCKAQQQSHFKYFAPIGEWRAAAT